MTRLDVDRLLRAAGSLDRAGEMALARALCDMAPDEWANALGTELGWPVPLGMANAWECGESLPPKRARAAAKRLVLPALTASGAVADGIGRRRFLKASVALAVASLAGAQLAPLPHAALPGSLDWERLMHPRPDDRMLIDLEAITHSAGRQVFVKKPGSLLPGISDHFEYLKQLLTNSPPDLKQRLCSIAGETAALAGQLSWRLGDPAGAVGYYVAAEDMAIRAGDSGLNAFVLGLRSVLYSGVWRTDGEADPRMALALLDKAVQVAGKTSRPHLKTFLFSVRAEENAVAGREVAAGHDLDRAHRATTEPHGFDEGFLSHWDEGRWAGYQAHCALVLRGKHVVRAIEEALAMTDPSLTGASSATLADLAAAYALEDEVECSCALLITSVVVAAQGGSQPHLRRALWVRREHLAHRADAAAVRELDQRLRTLMAARDRH